jgi:hypothetical protein
MFDQDALDKRPPVTDVDQLLQISDSLFGVERGNVLNLL